MRSNTDEQMFSVLVAIGLTSRRPHNGLTLVDIAGDYDESDPAAVAVQLIQEGLMATLTFEDDEQFQQSEDVMAEDLWEAAVDLLPFYSRNPETAFAEYAAICRAANNGDEEALRFCEDVVHTAAFGL